MSDGCKQLEPLLHDYAEGWLAESHQADLLRHLQRCAACREKLNAWETVSLALRELPRLTAPEPAPVPTADPEPRVALRLALALCLPTALLIVAYGNAWQPTDWDTLAPYANLHALFEWVQEPLITLWAWLRGVV
ncbi:MAG: hypothetical protein KatS3mg017_0752 [Fimbriimonadales bacterium]|nr:MAG: hypothetical protein KatS3mg017_0752 [Fimbriimonadales bacterium]